MREQGRVQANGVAPAQVTDRRRLWSFGEGGAFCLAE